MKVLYFWLKRIYYFYSFWIHMFGVQKIVVVDFGRHEGSARSDILKDMAFYLGDCHVEMTEKKSLSFFSKLYYFMFAVPVVVYARSYNKMDRVWFNIFDVDPKLYHAAAWSWHQLMAFQNVRKFKDVIAPSLSYKKFMEAKNSFYGLNKAYVFGTGPSLIKSLEHDFADGVRIACNTMVKSDMLWGHLRPNIIVAGDAIHHFSNAKYACNFRKDLYRRLKDDPLLFFVYPSDFHSFLSREFAGFEKQMIPLGYGIHDDPFLQFNGYAITPANDNVLTMLELPIAANLCKEILFLGFDGRGKTDQGFWKSSDEYNYLDDMPELRVKFPVFFYNCLERDKDVNAYVKKVHGEVLEKNMQKAEENGFRLFSMAASNTDTFQKRFIAYLSTKV